MVSNGTDLPPVQASTGPVISSGCELPSDSRVRFVDSTRTKDVIEYSTLGRVAVTAIDHPTQAARIAPEEIRTIDAESALGAGGGTLRCVSLSSLVNSRHSGRGCGCMPRRSMRASWSDLLVVDPANTVCAS
jgi:hypothetical protein